MRVATDSRRSKKPRADAPLVAIARRGGSAKFQFARVISGAVSVARTPRVRARAPATSQDSSTTPSRKFQFSTPNCDRRPEMLYTLQI